MRAATLSPSCVLLALALAALTAGCGRIQPGPAQFSVLRSYGWDSTVADPHAEWSPDSYQVLARSVGGFTLLDEGSGRQQYFAAQEKREMFHAAWLNGRQLAFGPANNVVRTADGRIVPNGDGISLVTFRPDRSVDNQVLVKAGFRPRRWHDRLVVQIDDRICLVGRKGKVEEFGPGFYAEPQADGEGLCWQETPAPDVDHWNVSTAPARLVIRWRPGVISHLPRGIEARWTAEGGVVATVLRADPPAQGPWWQAGTDLVHVSGPGAAPVVIATGLRSPAAHPRLPVVAATASDGRLVLVDLKGRPEADLAPVGDRPRWSADGARLLVEEPGRAAPVAPAPKRVIPGAADPVAGPVSPRYLRVYVLKVADPAAAP